MFAWQLAQCLKQYIHPYLSELLPTVPIMTLGLAKLKVDTFKNTLVMKNANRLLGALDYRLTQVLHALPRY